MSHTVRAGARRTLSNGDVVDVSDVKHKVPIRKRRNLTSDHETAHLLINLLRRKSVTRASIKAGPGYKGFMEGEFDPYSVIAPRALGLPGAGSKDDPQSDLGQLHARGYNPDSLAPYARKLIAENKTAFAAISTALEDHQEISGGHAAHIKHQAEKGGEVTIKVERKDGTKKTTTVSGIKEKDLVIPVDLSRPVQSLRA